jgi:hypothetical protein
MWLALTTNELLGAAGSVAGVIAAAPLVGGGVRKVRGLTTTRIKIELSETVWDDPRLSFHVFHVRDGKDDARDCGPPVNQACALKAVSRSAGRVVAIARLRHTKALGVQFKTFVDYDGLGFDEVRRILLDGVGGAHDVSPDGASDLHRAWFLLRNYQIVETPDHFTNNFVYPR